ncbi:MAG: hypothetical protein NZM38_05295 [Cytophagales bacterium]|nr:hypothetical protein [Cytophagales bacterium]MDW8384169.1 hypothetical protein [Flammeovirgaceae bacterium]
MKIPIIKKLVETYTSAELKKAEEALSEGLPPAIFIEGEDEGEQLTHAYAAYWIKEKIEKGESFTNALREYTQRVRQSIS